MADLLTHLLVAYALLTVLGWWVDPVNRRWVVVGMGGAAIPDLVKVERLVDADAISHTLGVPFTYAPISSLFGVVVIAGAIAVHFASHRRTAYAVLVTGGLSALLIDGLRAYAGGRAGFWLYPLWWRPPTPSLYVTSDYRVVIVGIALAGIVYLTDRMIRSRNSD